jgi:hypothetical protein
MSNLHFLVREESRLLTPNESESIGGELYAPVRNRQLLDIYMFNYCHYLGNGKYDMDEEDDIPFKMPGLAYKENSRKLSLNINVENLQIPMKIVTPKKLYNYGGQYKHYDFVMPFVALEPYDPDIFDELLETRGIVIVGCWSSHLMR